MTENLPWDTILKFCQQLTQDIGKELLKKSGKLPALVKEDGSLVTQADRWADGEIRKALTEKFPTHGLLTEETKHIFPDTDWCWVIDPIDGTTNFTRGVPIWAISLGLLYKGTPVFGFVHLPPLRISFHGYWQGNSGLDLPTGAYLNNQLIHTTADNPSRGHLFNLCARSLKILQKPFPCKIRMIGVASYNILLVAQGAAIGGIEASPKIWDLAAVWVILQAAGGVFVCLDADFTFPLQVGQNYGRKSLPTLALSRSDLIEVFKPLVNL
ncbi:MAG: inositol monophosphatase [Cyanobacteria bacterium J083]|nr:MAG: inositol monophosphatase [Cyanobacteria bacterium J083]